MQFLVIGLDGTDSEAPARRAAARPAHIARGDELLHAGALWYGAAIVDENGRMKGSMYFVDFPSETDMRAWLADEPYVQGDVWRTIEVHTCSVRDPWQFSRPQAFFDERSP